MKPLHDRILIEKEEFEKTEGGIFIPVSADPYNAPHPIGKAIAIGNKVEDIKEGDRFIYSRNVETPIEYKGKKYYLILESHILALV